MERSYKFGNESKDARKKQRETAQVQLRKSRRDELFSKRRQRVVEEGDDNVDSNSAYRGLYSSDIMVVFNSLNEIRKSVSSNETPPLQELIDSGTVPRVVELLSAYCSLYTKDLDKKTIFDCRYQAAWIITNIVSGTREQTETVVSLGVVKILNEMIVEDIIESYDLVDQAVWAISNIAGDVESCRDMVINDDGLERIVYLLDNICCLETYTLKEEFYIGILRNIAWLTSNLCRGSKKGLSLSHISRCLEVSSKLMYFSDKNVVIDSLWGISHALSYKHDLIDLFLQSKSVNQIFSMINCVSRKLIHNAVDRDLYKISDHCITPLLRIVGNIIAGNNDHVTFMLEYRGEENSCLLGSLAIVYSEYEGSRVDRIRKEICWIFSNLCAGEIKHTRELLKFKIYNLIFDSLVNQQFFIRVEACWCVINSCDKFQGDRDLFELFTQKGLLKALVECMETIDNLPDVQKGLLSVVDKLLEAGVYYGNMDGEDNKVLKKMSKYKVLDAVRYFLASENSEVYDIAADINAKYIENSELD